MSEFLITPIQYTFFSSIQNQISFFDYHSPYLNTTVFGFHNMGNETTFIATINQKVYLSVLSGSTLDEQAIKNCKRKPSKLS